MRGLKEDGYDLGGGWERKGFRHLRWAPGGGFGVGTGGPASRARPWYFPFVNFSISISCETAMGA